MATLPTTAGCSDDKWTSHNHVAVVVDCNEGDSCSFLADRAGHMLVTWSTVITRDESDSCSFPA